MKTELDRRKFLTYTGAAGAVAGAAWMAPTVLGSSAAFAAGSCVNSDQINWAAYADGAMSTDTGATYNLVPNRLPGGIGTPDYTVTMTVTPVGTVDSRNAHANVGNAYGNYAGVYELGMTGNSAGASSEYGWDVTFEWPTNRAAFALSWFLAVIDESQTTPGYVDYVHVSDASRWLASFYSTRIQGSGTATTPWRGIAGVQDKTKNFANITINDGESTGVTTLTIPYRGDSTRYGSFQSIGIPNLTWCL